MKKFHYLVFDIETAPLDFGSFSESQKEYIMRNAETDEEKDKKLFEMALSPFTSQVICIGLQLMDFIDNQWVVAKRAAFSTRIDLNESSVEENNNASDEDDNDIKENEVIKNEVIKEELDEKTNFYIASERKIVEDFWNILKKYNTSTLISFNGRNFDAPFLMLRSGLLKIRPTRNIMSGTKFRYNKHIDLADELSYYSSGRYGATKKYNFDFYTRAFGIKSPKADGVDGSNVHELFKQNEIKKIAEYCMRDVSATWDLFLTWDKYLRF